ncbi:anthranilate synthase component II [Boudabousia tangfeifanii]|uniref:anthranilate synthase n=1 Tax=Boudabousia tangfeifanii TaxID=1912795 RepID=A0A1D9MM76_9ACTO|nr:aminodeoxychorismate/anthranilate synthase component II [Boudabousia tangfeifanii]AOZ73299.1 anthranilate synthase component II [Boudabousia tangfeifanii]
MRVVLLDNRDSFVYNLVDLFASLGAEIEVYRNHLPASHLLGALQPTEKEQAQGTRPLLCLSPGPGHPTDPGCMMELLNVALTEKLPTLGICLGFQALVTACGGTIAPVLPVHGRSYPTLLTEAGRNWAGMSGVEGDTFSVARYHSLGTCELPDQLESLAVTAEGVQMAAKHKEAPAAGLQFHPESILTRSGPPLLRSLTEAITAGR